MELWKKRQFLTSAILVLFFIFVTGSLPFLCPSLARRMWKTVRSLALAFVYPAAFVIHVKPLREGRRPNRLTLRWEGDLNCSCVGCMDRQRVLTGSLTRQNRPDSWLLFRLTGSKGSAFSIKKWVWLWMASIEIAVQICFWSGYIFCLNDSSQQTHFVLIPLPFILVYMPSIEFWFNAWLLYFVYFSTIGRLLNYV